MVILQRAVPRWAAALALAAAATGLNFLLQPALGGRAPLLPFFPALIAAAALSGLGPGLVALLLSCVAVATFWVQPLGQPWGVHRPEDLAVLGFFLLGGGLTVAISAYARHLLLQTVEAQDRLAMVLAAGRMASWEWQVDDRKVVFSGGAEAVFGTTWSNADEAWPLGLPEDLPRVRQVIEEALRAGRHYTFVSRMHRADTGELRWIETHGYVHRRSDGRPWKVTGVTIDVTDRQQALEASRAAERRKDAFLATLAHELRNPMAPIRYAAAMLTERTPPKVLAQAREVIQRQSLHMTRLLDDLLDLSRITRNAITLRREVLDLRTLAQHAAESVRASMEAQRLRFVLSLPPQAVWVDGDATRLQQVLGNLLDNALKYTPAGGEVQLRLDEEGDEVLVRVSDTGLGLAPDMLPQVFELFTQLHRDSAGDRGGLGIGLSVVKQLVELHGGRVEVDSAGPGRGATFIVRLPRTAAPAAPSTVTATRSGDVVGLFDGGRSVLVVDDNEDAGRMLALLLREQGWTVRVAHDPVAALAAVDAAMPTLALLDIGLPGRSGHELASDIRARPGGDRVKLVAITGWGQEADRERSRKAGFDRHLVKPVDPESLLQVIHELLPRPPGQGEATPAAAGS